MPRPIRSDLTSLLEEARGLELLADDAEIAENNLAGYWQLSADLIALVADLESLHAERPGASYDDPEMFQLKYRLRQIASRLAEISEE